MAHIVCHVRSLSARLIRCSSLDLHFLSQYCGSIRERFGPYHMSV